jgi:hypothetical protein
MSGKKIMNETSALFRAGGAPAVPFRMIPVGDGDTDPTDETARKERHVEPIKWGDMYKTADGQTFKQWLKAQEKR